MKGHDLYLAGGLATIGERHRRQHVACQDHVAAVDTDAGVGLVVADGAGLIGGPDGSRRVSRNEVGAFLAAETAAAAIGRTMTRSTSLDEVMAAITQSLWATFLPLWRELGGRAWQALQTTLLVALVSEESTRIYANGDGYWGVVLPCFDGDTGPLGGITGEHLVETQRVGGVSIAGSQLNVGVANAATIAARNSLEAVRASFRCVLSCPRQVLGVHIATDGLHDERSALDRLRRGPVRHRRQLRGLLRRSYNCDDLGVAFASTFAPGMLGEDREPLSHLEEVAHV